MILPLYKDIDYTGSRFGTWTVQGYSHKNKHGHKYWFLVCDCGLEAVRHRDNLFRGRGLSCNKCYGKRISKENHYMWRGVGQIPGIYLSQIKISASVRQLPCEVSPEYLNSIFSGECSLSGLPISFEDKTASLDRISSKLGYIEGNVQWVHKDVNLMKNHFDQKYFIEVCRQVHKKYE